MLVNKDAYQRETLTKWPVWLPLTSRKALSTLLSLNHLNLNVGIFHLSSNNILYVYMYCELINVTIEYVTNLYSKNHLKGIS